MSWLELLVQTMPVELRGERMHAKCMTPEEQRMTVYFLNRERMAGRLCARCAQPFDAAALPNFQTQQEDR